MLIPLPGTPEFDRFNRRAQKDPNSVEAKAIQQMQQDAADQFQRQFRAKLQQMIELVPGQVFKDIAAFHGKFELPQTQDHGHRLQDDVLEFRVKFMQEELFEYCEAVGMTPNGNKVHGDFDAEKALDALIDLVYVAVGTAYLHRFPFNEGWQRVQDANMKKVRASGHDDPLSHRKHSADVVKPAGWVPPIHTDLLDEECTKCGGTGETSVGGGCMGVEDDRCQKCHGKGRTKRHAAIEQTAA